MGVHVPDGLARIRPRIKHHAHSRTVNSQLPRDRGAGKQDTSRELTVFLAKVKDVLDWLLGDD